MMRTEKKIVEAVEMLGDSSIEILSIIDNHGEIINGLREIVTGLIEQSIRMTHEIALIEKRISEMENSID